jgi:hypothetical protein
LQLRWNISCSCVVGSRARVVNATLPRHTQRGWDSLRHDDFFYSEGVPKLVRQKSVDPPTGQFGAAGKFGKERHWRRLQREIRRNPITKEEHEK